MITREFLRSGALFLLFAAASAAALLGALIAQYGFHLHPCHLCILQRIPHALVVALGIFAYRYNTDKHRKTILLVIGLVFTIGTVIALKHIGVEAGWFGSSCVADGAGGSLDDIRARIQNAPQVSCDQAMAYILGLSMAAWNAIYSFALATLAFTAARLK